MDECMDIRTDRTTHVSICPSMPSTFAHSCIYSFSHLFVHLSMHPTRHIFFHSFIPLFIHAHIHPPRYRQSIMCLLCTLLVKSRSPVFEPTLSV